METVKYLMIMNEELSGSKVMFEGSLQTSNSILNIVWYIVCVILNFIWHLISAFVNFFGSKV